MWRLVESTSGYYYDGNGTILVEMVGRGVTWYEFKEQLTLFHEKTFTVRKKGKGSSTLYAI